MLFEKGGDWERKNKLKVFEAVYFLIVRDFKQACELFVSAIPTFNAPEVMSYDELIFYVVLTGIIFLSRSEIKKKIIDSPEANVQLNKTKDLNEYLMSFYGCNYKRLFEKLGNFARQRSLGHGVSQIGQVSGAPLPLLYERDSNRYLLAVFGELQDSHAGDYGQRVRRFSGLHRSVATY